MPKHLKLSVDGTHFDRWLDLFQTTARELCPAQGRRSFRHARAPDRREPGTRHRRRPRRPARQGRTLLAPNWTVRPRRSAERLADRRRDFVPNSSIDFMSLSCGIVPTLICRRKRSLLEDLVLEEDLLDDLLGAADEDCAPRSVRDASNCARLDRRPAALAADAVHHLGERAEKVVGRLLGVSATKPCELMPTWQRLRVVPGPARPPRGRARPAARSAPARRR